MSDWIQTYTGVEFDPFDPGPEKIDIRDIARALSLTCRYGGHVRYFYSVGEHSVLMARLIPAKYRLWALLHDASEAYLNDIPRPLKRLPEMEPYRKLEAQLQTAIYTRFGLVGDEPEEVKRLDRWMLGLESRSLMPRHPAWRECQALIPKYIRDLEPSEYPEDVESQYLAMFEKCTSEK